MQEEAETTSGNSRREKRRRAILDAAAKLFLANGYERTTLSDFARQFIEAIFQPRTIAILRILAAEGTRIPEIAEAFFRMGPDVGDKKLAAFLQRSVEAGTLRPLDPVAMSRAFRSMVIGDTGMRVAAGAPIASQRTDALAQVGPAVEIFLSGVRISP